LPTVVVREHIGTVLSSLFSYVMTGERPSCFINTPTCHRSNYRNCELQTPEVTRPHDRVAAPPVKQSIVVSTGTGFFVSENGHVVTNAHVVAGCQTIRSLPGGTLSKLSTDDASDLAVYIASEKSKQIARLRGGRGPRAGEPVVAVGFPLNGLLSSDLIVTTGIISALSGLKNDRRTIQISAPVQPGDSGGPLLGENGSVVGVVVGKLDALKVAEATGDIPQNVNFAAPVIFETTRRRRRRGSWLAGIREEASMNHMYAKT
jgi:S1-C subfamily serine protease